MTITVRTMSIGLLLDGVLSQIPQEVIRRDYCHKTLVKLQRKNSNLMKNKEFQEAYTIAIDGWNLAKTKVDHEVATSQVVRFLIEKEPWLINYFKLNQKHLNKIYKAFNTTEYQLRSMKAARVALECIDILIAQYNYRKSKLDLTKSSN